MAENKYREGAIRFREGFFRENRDLFRQLEKGQSPDTILITCSDSRVVPHLKTGAFPGDIFVLRNMGNIVPPYREDGVDETGVGAFLEYGIDVLGAKHIIIMGHTHCGAVTGILKESEKVKKSLFIKGWLRIGSDLEGIVRKKYGTMDEGIVLEEACEENVRFQLANLHSFPFVRERLEDGKISLHGWLYRVKTGEVLFLNRETDTFTLLA